MRGIARVTGVSWDWLQKYVNSKMSHIPRCISVTDKSKGRLTLECDEMWSFILSKKNEVYVWLAIDRDTREIVGCYIGDITRKSARKLWRSLPSVYRQCAVTDKASYPWVIIPGAIIHQPRFSIRLPTRIAKAEKRRGPGLRNHLPKTVIAKMINHSSIGISHIANRALMVRQRPPNRRSRILC
jgi:hypothetical protein